MKRKTIDIITLGCSKNLVDSEHLMRQLEEVGFHVTHDAERPKGQIAVINTCGFIGDAKEESINMILEFAQAKEEGNLEKLYVMEAQKTICDGLPFRKISKRIGIGNSSSR